MTAKSFTEAFTAAAETVDLEALTALEAAATPGPWVADTFKRGDCVVWGPRPNEFITNIGHVIVPMIGPEMLGECISFDAEEHNTRLIVAARNALPALVEEVKQLSERLDSAIGVAVTLEGQNAAMEARIEAADAEGDELRAEVQQLIDSSPSIACPVVGCSGDQCVLCEGAMRLPVCSGTDEALARLVADMQSESDALYDRLATVSALCDRMEEGEFDVSDFAIEQIRAASAARPVAALSGGEERDA